MWLYSLYGYFRNYSLIPYAADFNSIFNTSRILQNGFTQISVNSGAVTESGNGEGVVRERITMISQDCHRTLASTYQSARAMSEARAVRPNPSFLSSEVLYMLLTYLYLFHANYHIVALKTTQASSFPPGSQPDLSGQFRCISVGSHSSRVHLYHPTHYSG